MSEKNTPNWSELQKQLILKDYDNVFSYRQTYSVLRLSTIGASLTFLGLIGSQIDFEDWISVQSSILVMLIASYITVQAVIILTRGLHIFSLHNKWVENKIGIVGFSSYWLDTYERRATENASHAYKLMIRAISLVTAIFGIAISLTQLITLGYVNSFSVEQIIQLIVIPSTLLLSIIILFTNEYFIRAKMDTSEYLPELESLINPLREEELRKLQLNEFDSNPSESD